jgi:phosphatidate cytidylyltransferase
MLRWRLSLGTLIVTILVGLCWLDHWATAYRGAVPGLWLMPAAVIFVLLASGEVLHLAAAGGLRPLGWAVYLGNLLLLAAAWIPQVCCRATTTATPLSPAHWPLVALAVATIVVLVGEMGRYRKPGGVTTGAAVAVFGLVYVGVLFGFVVQLRMAWGVGALASLVIVVKMSDTGAYAVGRLIGRHKMTPVLSPGKTIEGAFGQLAFACIASWATFSWLVPATRMASSAIEPAWWGWLAFGLLIGVTGMLGDLAESLIKRDVGCKDSSRWLPGFGGVLDLLDSILLAAPVAWLCWAGGVVG